MDKDQMIRHLDDAQALLGQALNRIFDAAQEGGSLSLAEIETAYLG